MGNLTARTAIKLANAILGLKVETGLLNVMFEILDGELVVETLEGDPAIDAEDYHRMRFLIGAVIFGEVSAVVMRKFNGFDDLADASERVPALIDGLESEEIEEPDVARAVNGHDELMTAVVFTVEQDAAGAVAYRLYRNPMLSLAQGVGYLKNIRAQFERKMAAAAHGAADGTGGTNGTNGAKN